MHDAFTAPPWGNLFRWVVSTGLFVAVIGLPLALARQFLGASPDNFVTPVVLLVSAVVAAIVVWAEAVPWPGD